MSHYELQNPVATPHSSGNRKIQRGPIHSKASTDAGHARQPLEATDSSGINRTALKSSGQKRQESAACDPEYSSTPSTQPFHKPNTSHEEEHVYVLTLKLTPSLSAPLNQMREDYFPKHLNRTPAHLTLFHALPHSQMEFIDRDLATVSSETKPFGISTGSPFRMRRGVGVGLGSGSKESLVLREEFRERWLGWLSDQDAGAWRPHWTVMNKVNEPKKVDQAFNTIRRILFDEACEGKAVGVDVWRYEKGDWEWVKEYPFLGNGKPPSTRPGSMDEEGHFGSKRRASRDSEIPGTGAGGPGALKRGGNKVAGFWRSIKDRRDSRIDHEGE